jgi:hypothetical protein
MIRLESVVIAVLVSLHLAIIMRQKHSQDLLYQGLKHQLEAQ